MANISRRNLIYLTTASTLATSWKSHAAVLRSYGAEKQRLLEYLEGTAPRLLRPAVGQFAHPSVSPSLPESEYSASLWDWDTLWSCRGLLAYSNARHDQAFHDTLLEHCEGSFENFFDHQSPDGRLPVLMTDQNPDLLGSTAKGASRHANQAKPVFAQLAMLILGQGGKIEWVRPYFDPLLRFYSAWERTNRSACGLFVWGDDVAIGDDNDPTTFGRPFFSSANLLLNCLFYSDFMEAAELARRLGREGDAERLHGKGLALADAIRGQCWDPRDHFFYTADVQCVDHRAELIPQIKPGMPMSWKVLPLRIQMFTGFLPMWCGIASKEQARQMVETNYLADDRIRCDFGVRTLSNRETMYSLAFSSNPSNWLGPVWIIANYFVWKALRNYGYEDEARELANKTLTLLVNDIERGGSMNEYYHPDTGAALSHKGFMDWNLLVSEMTVPETLG
jgi:putative isomerase